MRITGPCFPFFNFNLWRGGQSQSGSIDSFERQQFRGQTAQEPASRAIEDAPIHALVNAVARRQYRDADLYLSEMIKAAPTRAAAYACRGALRRNLQMLYAASDDLNCALRLEPGNRTAILNRRLIPLDLKDRPELCAVERIARANPQDRLASLVLALELLVEAPWKRNFGASANAFLITCLRGALYALATL